MKNKQDILSMLFAKLHELQNSTPSQSVKARLIIEVELLSDILQDDVPEEFWEQIEEIIFS